MPPRVAAASISPFLLPGKHPRLRIPPRWSVPANPIDIFTQDVVRQVGLAGPLAFCLARCIERRMVSVSRFPLVAGEQFSGGGEYFRSLRERRLELAGGARKHRIIHRSHAAFVEVALPIGKPKRFQDVPRPCSRVRHGSSLDPHTATVYWIEPAARPE